MESEETDMPFLLEVQDVFFPKNLNPDEVVVSGHLVSGMVMKGDAIDIVGFSPEIKQAIVVNIVYQEIGAFYILQGVTKQDLWRGQVLASPGTIQPHTTFLADILLDERIEKITQQPFQGVVRYRFHIRGTDLSGTVVLPEGKETLAHGDQFSAKVILNEPLAIEEGLRFGIGRFLGQGTVTEILE